ncbi:amidohydrolase/deacetylase family metallohydrolase [Komagataeibacter sp. FNDCF1]|uniref:amidohydrolase/deacetylase family metallohydrolase n=1 Tax=Komagataeibacter sp. FNDCF1 TaxID=2878681 RepID=UPI001E6453DF|nr:amidohydrolase/deacetylase family metallohydrolase [Komagataeibacter sp. FNDCF1]MCE2563269.1 amidohydrolase/deacetylase family metallohydrolase [Komagataeibacter sp. FNDCF1]
MRPVYDLVLQGGTVIDPMTGLHQVADIAVAGSRIAAVESRISPPLAREIVDVSGRIVTAGMIDTHGHIYEHVTGRFGLNPDLVGVRSGVTTIIDQGGPSCMTVNGFRHYVAEPADTRVLAFLSAYLVGGLEGHLYPELYGPGQTNIEHSVRAARENADLIRGIKAHAEVGGVSRWGLEVMRIGKAIAREANIPLYIHLGQLWPTAADNPDIDADELVRELLPIMEEGDVLAHPFTRHPGGFISEETGQVHPVIWAALERGVKVDVGHGSHFSFDMAAKVMAEGIVPYTLGADMHGYNVRVPSVTDIEDRQLNPFAGVSPFNLTVAMSKLLYLGMKLDDVIATVTANPARMIGMSDTLGSLQVGREADISVLDLKEGAFTMSDNSGARVTARRMFVPEFCLRGGVRFEADSPLVPPLEEVVAA